MLYSARAIMITNDAILYRHYHGTSYMYYAKAHKYVLYTESITTHQTVKKTKILQWLAIRVSIQVDAALCCYLYNLCLYNYNKIFYFNFSNIPCRSPLHYIWCSKPFIYKRFPLYAFTPTPHNDHGEQEELHTQVGFQSCVASFLLPGYLRYARHSS